VRRIALLTAVALLSTAAIAYAVDNTLTYTATIKKSSSKKPTTKAPVPIQYTGTLNVDTNPPGQQPDIAPTTTVYFAKNIKQYAKYFPSCKVSDIDGKGTFPTKCNKAIVGKGTATAYAGDPGSDRSGSIKEDLTVKAVNGNGGKQLMLVVTSQPGALVAIQNRVVPGTLKPGKGPYGFSIQFDIPENLQVVIVPVALSYFNVTVSPKTIKKTINGKVTNVSFLGLTARCPAGKDPSEAITVFKDKDGNLSSKTSDSTTKC
jgi:hypothetical protein